MKKGFFDSLKRDMHTAQKVLAYCNQHKAEFHVGENHGFMVVVPRQLTEEEQAELRAIIPDKALTFTVGPKMRTRDALETLIQRVKPQAGKIDPDLDGRSVSIELEGVPEDDPVWGEMSSALRSDGFFDSWKFIIGGQETKVLPKVSEELATRKGRATLIKDDDITDLKIGLANAQTVDDILKAMGG